MLKIIAEIGSVHDGSFGNACKLIELAAECGANAVKFQTHIADAETLAAAPSPGYFNAESRMDYFKRTSFTVQQWKELCAHSRKNNIEFISSPFSIEAVELLEEVGVERYKIPSGEVTNTPLLNRVKETGKPVILSSGMSNWKELDAAVSNLKTSDLTLLQCSSLYPCPDDRVGLNVITQMKDRYGVSVGFSDHTLGMAASIGAVAYGATVIEKHFTFSRKMYGSDAKHSMEPDEFLVFCDELKSIHRISAYPVDKDDISLYKDMKRIFEKSIVTKREVSAGEKITMDNIAFKKPGSGIRADRYLEIVGKSFRNPLSADHIIDQNDIV